MSGGGRGGRAFGEQGQYHEWGGRGGRAFGEQVQYHEWGGEGIWGGHLGSRVSIMSA